MSGVEATAVIQLIVASALGGLIGLERSVFGKQAGMRTYALVALASCVLTVMSVLVSSSYIGLTSFDPLRVAAAIVMGIGFIGTGIVVHREGSNPMGVTTTAGIWVAAAIGISVGFRLYILAIATAILTLIIFTAFSRVERAIQNKVRGSLLANSGEEHQ